MSNAGKKETGNLKLGQVQGKQPAWLEERESEWKIEFILNKQQKSK